MTNQQLVQLQVDLKDKTKAGQCFPDADRKREGRCQDYEMRKQSRKSEEDVIKEAEILLMILSAETWVRLGVVEIRQ